MSLYSFHHTRIYGQYATLPPDHNHGGGDGEDPDDIPDVVPTNPVNGQSITSGLWSNPATWKGGIIPVDIPVIISTTHVVTYDLATTVVRGITIQASGKLRFKPDSTTYLETKNNLLVLGTLEMKPTNPATSQFIRFVGINEAAMIGGGMDPLATDVGLWVMGAGKLDIVGSAKTPWTFASNSVNIGATSFTVDSATGWRVGDEIVIVPMDIPPILPNQNDSWDNTNNHPRDNYKVKFEKRTITAINGNTISFTGALLYAHPIINSSISSTNYGNRSRTYKPEVLNLTRNVRIKGSKDAGNDHISRFHRYHTFIRSTAVHTVRYLEQEYTGPRKITSRHAVRPDIVQGRYGLHFHHCMDASIGTEVEGCVIHNSGNRCYVPHMSNGITIKNCITFHSLGEGYWWDARENSHNITYEDNIIACQLRNGLDNNIRGMLLNMGDDNAARRNRAIYAHNGDPDGGGAYTWDADTEGVWVFEDNVGHSNVTVVFVWQNTSHNHIVVRQEAFNNAVGVFHGAYINAYQYLGGYFYKSPIDIKATPGLTSGVLVHDVYSDAAGDPYCILFHDSPIGGSANSPNQWVKCVFANYTVAALQMFTTMPDSNEFKNLKVGDMVLCEFKSGPAIFFDPGGNAVITGMNGPTYNLKNGNLMRVQPISGARYKIERVNQQDITTTNIPQFSPLFYGTGVGLLGEYYNDSTLTNKVFERVDTMIVFQAQWEVNPKFSPFGVHHKVQGNSFSMRWTGFIQAQYTEPHSFLVNSGGGFRVWVNNVLMLDSWFEKAKVTDFYESGTMNLVAGQKYAIRVEHFNSTPGRRMMLYWKSPSMPIRNTIPTLQNYPS